MPKKLFIIEDDANILYSLQAKFSLKGFDVKIDNGNVGIEELISKIKENKPNFIILDLILPQLDGFDIIKTLKEDQETSNIDIFIFTNLSDQDSKSKGLNLGVKHYFIKGDFSIDDLVEKTVKIINNMNK